MARVKDWLIDMESAVGEALDKGLVDIKDILQYCKKAIGHVDEQYVRECVKQWENY